MKSAKLLSTFVRNNLLSRCHSTVGTSGLVRPITVRTCVGLYPRLQAENPKLYRRAPGEGIDITVEYCDTAIDDPKKVYSKTIVAIPGAAGHYGHYEQLIAHYRHSPVRVIAPTIPDFGHTRSNWAYWHSTREKVTFLRDFLRQIGVDRIDCLASHSFGMHEMLALCREPGDVRIKSLALFAPQPIYDMTPTTAAIGRRLLFPYPLLYSDWWYRFQEWTGVFRLKALPVKFDHFNDFVSFMLPVLHHKQVWTNLPGLIGHVAQPNGPCQIPIAIIYGTKEKFISPNARERIYRMFGVVPEDIIHLNPQQSTDADKIIKGGSRIKVYLIEGGGHFAFANYFEPFTRRIVDDLLGNVVK